MPFLLLIAALCAGFACATVFLSLGGSVLGALGVYVLAGNLMMAAMGATLLLRRPG